MTDMRELPPTAQELPVVPTSNHDDRIPLAPINPGPGGAASCVAAPWPKDGSGNSTTCVTCRRTPSTNRRDCLVRTGRPARPRRCSRRLDRASPWASMPTPLHATLLCKGSRSIWKAIFIRPERHEWGGRTAVHRLRRHPRDGPPRGKCSARRIVCGGRARGAGIRSCPTPCTTRSISMWRWPECDRVHLMQARTVGRHNRSAHYRRAERIIAGSG